MEITHQDINKYIKKFITSKQGNVSFLLTNNKFEHDVKVSIQGQADAKTLFNMFVSLFASQPDIIPVFMAAINNVQKNLPKPKEVKEVEDKKERLIETMTGKLLM